MAAAQQFSTLYQIDDLIKLCASEADQIPLLGYPRTEYSVDDYVKLTGKGIDAYVDGAVRALVAQGLSLQVLSYRRVAGILLIDSELDRVSLRSLLYSAHLTSPF